MQPPENSEKPEPLEVKPDNIDAGPSLADKPLAPRPAAARTPRGSVIVMPSPAVLRRLLISSAACAAVLLLLAGVAAWRLSGGWWSRYAFSIQFGSAGDENVQACAFDGAGGAYIAGTTNGNLHGKFSGAPGSLGNDLWIARLAPSGAVLWIRQFGSGGDETVGGIATDPAGDVVLAGSTDGDFAAPNGGAARPGGAHHDVFVLKVDPDGRVQANRQDAAPGDEVAQAMAIMPDGGVLAAGDTDHLLYRTGSPTIGSSQPEPSSNIFLTRYDARGNRVWGIQWGGTVDDSVDDVAVDPAGNIFVTGSTIGMFNSMSSEPAAFLAKFSPNGELLWGADFPGGRGAFPTAVSCDSDGNSYLCARRSFDQDGPRMSLSVSKFDPAGRQDRVVEISAPEGVEIVQARPDAAGGLYLAGLSRDGAPGRLSGILARYAPGGGLMWARQIGGAGSVILTGVTPGAFGSVCAFGLTDGSLFAKNRGGDDAVVMRVSGSGKIAGGS